MSGLETRGSGRSRHCRRNPVLQKATVNERVLPSLGNASREGHAGTGSISRRTWSGMPECCRLARGRCSSPAARHRTPPGMLLHEAAGGRRGCRAPFALARGAQRETVGGIVGEDPLLTRAAPLFPTRTLAVHRQPPQCLRLRLPQQQAFPRRFRGRRPCQADHLAPADLHPALQIANLIRGRCPPGRTATFVQQLAAVS